MKLYPGSLDATKLMMHFINLKALVFVLNCLSFSVGIDCTSKYYNIIILTYMVHTYYSINSITDHCCYYYSTVPRNVTTVLCNPEGLDISWGCWVHSPHEDNTTLTVQWYKAALGTTDMAQGELLSERSDKYDFTTTRLPPLPIFNSSELNGLILDEFILTISNFSSSNDDGYYWCQIVVNGSCLLEPSPTRIVALSQYSMEKCDNYTYNVLDFIEYDMPPICGQLGTLCNHGAISTTAGVRVTDIQAAHSVVTSATLYYGIIGGLIFIIILLLMIIIACAVCNARNRKMNKAIKGIHGRTGLNCTMQLRH